MRRKLTQAMALGMAAMMTVGMLAGCGGKKDEGGHGQSPIPCSAGVPAKNGGAVPEASKHVLRSAEKSLGLQ